MSIKILLISSNEELFHNIENVFTNHMEKGSIIIYSLNNIENSLIKITYDVIITEEKYLSLIPIKNLPIIIINSTGSEIKNNEPNLIYVENPLKIESLYELILSLQYRFHSSHLSNIQEPIIKNYTNPLNTNVNVHINENQNDAYMLDNPIPINIMNIKDAIKIIDEKQDINELKINTKENHQLVTKFYNLEDLQKITKILNNYGEENQVDNKIIAQASIILDELLYTLENLENFKDNSKEPKILMTVKNYNKEFHMNIECLLPLEDKIQNIISIAQDYGNTIQSFKRNNSYYLNVNWYL
jgi:hypothetical protein